MLLCVYFMFLSLLSLHIHLKCIVYQLCFLNVVHATCIAHLVQQQNQITILTFFIEINLLAQIQMGKCGI